MKNLIGIALLAGGIVLLVLGFQDRRTVESRLSGIFSGGPGERPTWELVGGAAGAVAGAALILLPSKRSK